MSDNETTNKNNIIDIKTYKRNKKLDKELTRNRKPLYISYLDGQIKGSPHFTKQDDLDFLDRMNRIKDSLERINKLMSDLKNKTKE